MHALTFPAYDACTCPSCRVALWCRDGNRGQFFKGVDRCAWCGLPAIDHLTVRPCTREIQMTACPRCQFDPDAKILASWTFTIDKEVKSMNRSARNKGTPWAIAEYRKDRDEWISWMMLARANHRITKATGRRRLLITRIYGYRQRTFDKGNFIGGCKPALDAMTHVGLLVDDKPAYLEDHYDQVHGEVAGVRFHLEELG